MNPESKHKPNREIRPGLTAEDYYLNEQGWMVFTKAYHLKRGYCCKSGCLHCPYGYRKSKDSSLPE